MVVSSLIMSEAEKKAKRFRFNFYNDGGYCLNHKLLAQSIGTRTINTIIFSR
jgi:hypothetical protein